MNIKELAEQAGLDWHRGWTLDDNEPNRFTVFAMLVAAHEREECAKLFDERDNGLGFYEPHEPAEIIRARSKA
jgi:hypothetical protein